MAIKPDTLFPGKTNPADTNYPLGSARNVTTSGDGTGTPFVADLVNDSFGFYQSLLAAAGITANGSPDSVGNAQYLAALVAVTIGSLAADDGSAKIGTSSGASLQDFLTALPKSHLIERKSFEMIAHRGFKGSNPEHTMMAYTTAVRQGADALELDLQVTSDGVVVVFHDALMETKTNLTGTIASKTESEVTAAEYDSVQSSPIYFNVKIPTFAEVLEYAKEVSVKLFIEIKEIRTNADIALMINQADAAGMLSMTSWSSFQQSRVEEARSVNSSIEVGLIGSTGIAGDYEPIFDSLALLGRPLMIVWSNASLIDNPQIAVYAKSLGIDVAAYTLTNSSSVRALVAQGITRIIADVPLRGR